MSLKYKVGDLIEAVKNGEVNVFAHGCNCHCAMGRGIAPLIKEAFPKMYAADLKTEKGDKAKLGTYTMAFLKDGTVAGFNLYSQYGYTLRKQGLRDLDYNALYDALDQMKKVLQSFTDSSMADYKIGLPLIGCGLAGGNWRIVSRIIEEVLVRDGGLDVTIYTLEELPAWLKE